MTDPTPPLSLPRGIRNKNPGNVRHSPVFSWRYELSPDDEGFCRFPDPTHGIRIIIILFHNYQELEHRTTIDEMISRWAPNTENDSADYARYVAGRLMLPVTTPVNFMDVWHEWTRAIVSYENGQDPYTPTQYTDALGLANIR